MMLDNQYPTQEMLSLIVNIGEYAGVLEKQQSYNVAEVSFLYYKEKDQTARDNMLAKLLKQPIMARAYKASKLEPENVSAYVNSVLAWPKKDKDDMIMKMWATYSDAGDEHDHDAANQISDGREWAKLCSDLANSFSITYPMRDFVQKQQTQATKDSEIKENSAFPFGKKIWNLLRKRKGDCVIIAAGVCAGLGINYAGNAYISACDKVEAKKHTKETVAQTNTQKNSGKTSTLQLKPEDFRGSPRSS